MEPLPIPEKALRSTAGVPAVFKPPEGSQHIGELQVLMVEDFRSVLLGQPPRAGRFISWWSPSQAEIEKLVKGAPIRLELIGATHVNPMRIEVGADLD